MILQVCIPQSQAPQGSKLGAGASTIPAGWHREARRIGFAVLSSSPTSFRAKRPDVSQLWRKCKVLAKSSLTTTKVFFFFSERVKFNGPLSLLKT